MLTRDRANQILGKVLQLAKAPGSECIASLSGNRQGNTRFAVNEISSSADVEKQSLSVTIQIGKRQASATTNQLDDRSLADVVARAARMAKLAPENPEALPPLVVPLSPVALPPVALPPVAFPPVVEPPAAPPVAAPPVAVPPLAAPPRELPPVARPPVVEPPLARPPAPPDAPPLPPSFDDSEGEQAPLRVAIDNPQTSLGSH